jgi:hypothetical protein
MRMLRVVPGDMELMVETSWKIKQHAKDADREDAMDNGKTVHIVPVDELFLLQYSRGHLRVLPGDLEPMIDTSWKMKQHAKDADRGDAMDSDKTSE